MTDVVRACRRTWKQLGVPHDAIEEMAADLEADLSDAAAEDVTPEEYLAGDPRELAAAWARERGLVTPRLRAGLTSVAAVVGAVPGAAFGLFAAYGLSSPALGEMFGRPVRVGVEAYEMYLEPPAWLLLGLYAVGAGFAYAGALAAVGAALAWRHDPAAGRTVRTLAAWLPLVVFGAIAATIAFSWLLGHSTEGHIVVADVAVAACSLAAGVAIARAVVVREARGRGTHGEGALRPEAGTLP
jgi:hypothetical protein